MAEGTSIAEDYARQADEFVRVLEACPVEALTPHVGSLHRPFTEIIGQLTDAELVASVRIRRIITQDLPNLYHYDAEMWLHLLDYQNQDLQNVALLFTALRQTNGALLEQIAYEDWKRTGHKEEGGEISLFQLIEKRIAQTEECLDQLRAAVIGVTSQTNGHGGYVIQAPLETEAEGATSGVKFYALALMAGLTILSVGFFTQSRPIYFFGGIISGIGILLILLTLLKRK